MNDIRKTLPDWNRAWKSGLPETVCGIGSTIKKTEIQREILSQWVNKYNIKTISDIGAGDLNWIKLIKWDVIYTPYDLIPRSPEIIQFDILKQIPPTSDAILMLYVLNHLDQHDAALAIQNIQQSKSKYFIYTWIPSLMWRFLDLKCTESIVINKQYSSELRLCQSI